MIRHAKGLARLHRALGEVPALPGWVKVSDGKSVVHLDLQPDNVKLTDNGPVRHRLVERSRGRLCLRRRLDLRPAAYRRAGQPRGRPGSDQRVPKRASPGHSSRNSAGTRSWPRVRAAADLRTPRPQSQSERTRGSLRPRPRRTRLSVRFGPRAQNLSSHSPMSSSSSSAAAYGSISRRARRSCTFAAVSAVGECSDAGSDAGPQTPRQIRSRHAQPGGR